MLTLAALYPDDTRIKEATRDMAGSIIAKCTDCKRVTMGAQPNQLAAVPGALSLSNR
jgi:hypothetical protein